MSPDINPSLPIVGQPDSSEEPKIVTALSQLIAAVNDVDSAQIQDLAVTTADLAAGAVTTAKIATLPRCRVIQTIDSATLTGVPTPIPFGSESYDTDTMHDLVTNTTRVVAKTAGVYFVVAQGVWQSNNTGTRIVSIRKNGTKNIGDDEREANPVASAQTAQTATAVVQLAVNDYVEMVVTQTSGGNLNLVYVDDASPVLSATWVGP